MTTTVLAGSSLQCVLAVDHSRVKLLPTEDDETGDYINANYMPVSLPSYMIK